jgi:hypothetical protein
MDRSKISAYGWAAVTEAIKVIFHGRRVNTCLPHALLEQWRVMDTLATGENLLATDEKVVRVREFVVVRVAHGIKWSYGSGELV